VGRRRKGTTSLYSAASKHKKMKEKRIARCSTSDRAFPAEEGRGAESQTKEKKGLSSFSRKTKNRGLLLGKLPVRRKAVGTDFSGKKKERQPSLPQKERQPGILHCPMKGGRKKKPCLYHFQAFRFVGLGKKAADGPTYRRGKGCIDRSSAASFFLLKRGGGGGKSARCHNTEEEAKMALRSSERSKRGEKNGALIGGRRAGRAAVPG